MEAFTHTWNLILSLGTFVSLAICILLVYSLLVKDTLSQKISAFVSQNILWIGLGVSLVALVSSLVYSDIIGFAPCLLCWYTRVFFYPQVFLFGLALYRKERSILPYTLLLTTVGLIIGTYHYITESLQYSPLPCAVTGVSCLTRYVYEFGFITIPFMGLVGFLTLFLSLLLARKTKKSLPMNVS